LFAKYGLDVELHREVSWTQIRDKVVYGELDAAHAPASLPFITNLCLDSDQCACVTGLVLSLQGNGILLSNRLWTAGARDAASLRKLIFRDWGRRTYTLGVVFPYSSHRFLLRQWLQQGGIDPDVEVRIVAMPPAQMFPALTLGYLDGYCVGEPWITVAAAAGAGRRVAGSDQLAPYHPEKALMVTRDFAENRADEHERLIAALLEACAACERPEVKSSLSQLLSQPRYISASAQCILEGLSGSSSGDGASSTRVPEHPIFHRCNANDPTDGKASWIMDHLYDLLEHDVLKIPTYGRVRALKNVFRRDIFERARDRVDPEAGLIDIFDPQRSHGGREVSAA
jgi:ABC-type nitrate/sulfonate/bicarbonate transport system substrate-binding protein